MSTSFRLNANELDAKFLEKVKALFASKEIEITISELDETEFLKRDPADFQRLLDSIEQIKRGEGIRVDPKLFG